MARTDNGPLGKSISHLGYPFLTLGAFWSAIFAFVICWIQAITGYPFRTTIALDRVKILWVEGFAYTSPLPANYSPRGAESSSARLRENGTELSLYSGRESSVVKVGRGIFSVPERGRLLFSTTDNSDPRTNGRKYSVELPLRVSRGVLPICFVTWLTLAVALVFFRLPDGRAIAWRTMRRAGIALRWAVALVGRWPAIVISIPSIYLLISYPPLWKDVDALGQLTLPACDLNILHFPPVYCFLARIPFVITSWLSGVGGHGVQSLFQQQAPSLTGIFLLVVIQHLMLIAALTYTVLSVTRHRQLRGLFALLLSVVSANYAQVQCCGSEALSISAIFALTAAGFSILRDSTRVSWIVYGIALFLAIGSRHINLLFAIFLPQTVILLGLTSKMGWCAPDKVMFRWRTFVTAILIGFSSLGLNLWVAHSMIAAVHDEYRSTLGRTLSDRIGAFLDTLSIGDRLRLAQELCAKTSDPAVRMAIELQATEGPFYKGTGQTIADYLVSAHWPAAKIGAARDRIMLSATVRYLMTMHPALIAVIWRDFVKGAISADNSQIAMSPFRANVFCALDNIKRPEAWAPLAALPGTDLARATVTVDAASRDPYVNLGRNLPLCCLILLAIVLSGISSIIHRHIPRTVLIGCSALATGVAVFAATSVCVYYMERYTLPMLATALIAILAAGASLSEFLIDCILGASNSSGGHLERSNSRAGPLYGKLDGTCSFKGIRA